jgi:hypothetical protein
MPFLTLDIPPGVFRNGTAYQSQGRYFNADLIRWGEAAIEPIGGWTVQSQTPLAGKARRIIAWSDNSRQIWAAVGTHSHLYALARAGGVANITPAGFTAGQADAVLGGGYGVGIYNDGLYGTPRTSGTNVIPASVWSLATFGEVLIGTMGRTIYEWTLDTGTPAAPVTGAPIANAVLVTDERIIFALGADNDPRAVDWCSAENRNDWTPSSTNLAGGKRLQTNGALQTAEKVRGGYLILSNVDAHFARYVGLPFVYQFNSLSEGCGVVSKGGAINTPDETFWMGEETFWTYNGFVAPLPCDVADYVFGDINRLQISKVSGWNNSLKGEAWWHYPSAASIECDRYVYFDYRKRIWGIGQLGRLCGIDKGVFPQPQLVAGDGVVYNHEIGDMKDARSPFVTSGPVQIGEGDRTMGVRAYIPDEATLGQVNASFSVRDYPMDAPISVAAVPAASKTDLRFSGRMVSVTFTGDPDVAFRIGAARFDVKPGSGR